VCSRSGLAALLAIVGAIGQPAAADHAAAPDYKVVTRPNLVYAVHDRTRLLGDLYLPQGLARAPILIAMHGGGWRGGDRRFYKYWGPFLARRGYALFTVEYRLGAAGVYPAAIYDVKAAIQFVRANAAKFDIDPERIGLMGDSAGGYLAAMLALAGNRFTAPYRDDANAAVSTDVKAVVGFYGIYDMLAQWKQDMAVTPGDSIVQDFLGASPSQNGKIYAEASPISYATPDRNSVRFLLIHGDRDDLVDAATQSGAFNAALMQSGFLSRLVLIPGAAHYWASDPFENNRRSFGAIAAPSVLQFLEGAL
jgi:acetyl esterase/lipase